MKKAFIIGLIAVSATAGLTSCLDTDSGRFVEAGGEMTAQDSAYRLMSVLDGVRALGPRLVLLGELRGDLMKTTPYANREERQINDWTLNENLENKYLSQREYYKIINECNYIIKYGNALPKEQAVAITIRAWTYLQLVLNFGKVEYYTEPILSDADADKQYPEYDIDELADILIPQLEAVKDVPKPGYGALDGYVLSYQYIDTDFLLGDLYLWRGQGDDYEKAAAQYMRLIRRDKYDPNYPAYSSAPYTLDESSNSVTVSTSKQRYLYPFSNFSGWVGSNQRRNAGDLLGFSDPQIGDWQMVGEEITDVVYFNQIGAVQSNLDTLSGLESSIAYRLQPQEAKEKIAITASPVVGALFGSVPYTYLERENEYVINPFQSWLVPPVGMTATKGDLRINGTFSRSPGMLSGRPNVETNPEYPDSVIAKYLDYGGFQNKMLSIYRVGSLYLRYAEAVNRAGKPSLAMIVLKYGLTPDNVLYYMAASEKPATDEYSARFVMTTVTPTGTVYSQIPSLNTTARRVLYAADAETQVGTTENGVVYIEDEFADQYIARQNESYYIMPITTVLYDDGGNVEPRLTVKSNGSDALGDTVAYLFRSGVEGYYDIPRTMYANVGLHWRGAGCAAADTTYKMPNVLYPNDVMEQQKYMEKLIADEYALETAFEGGRFYDLMRISKHQQNPVFLVERVAKKYGAEYQTFYDKLLVGRNGWYATSWYLPRQRQE